MGVLWLSRSSRLLCGQTALLSQGGSGSSSLCQPDNKPIVQMGVGRGVSEGHREVKPEPWPGAPEAPIVAGLFLRQLIHSLYYLKQFEWVFYDLEMKTLWLIQTDNFLASFKKKLNSNQTRGENVEAFSLNAGIQYENCNLQKTAWKKSWISGSRRSRRGGIEMGLRGPDTPGALKRPEQIDVCKRLAHNQLQSQGIQLHSLKQGLLNSRWFFLPGDIWQRLKTYTVVTIEGKVRDAPKHLTMYREPPHTIRNGLAQEVNNAEVESPPTFTLSVSLIYAHNSAQGLVGELQV